MLTSFKRWLKDDGATAAIEAGIMFPLLVMILCSIVDTGVGVLTNQKVINASQMIDDLLTRKTSVTDADITNAITAGQMALMPFSTTTYGVDIAGIQYIGLPLTPTVQWRKTQNMTANDLMTTHSAGLGDQNEGVVAVTVQYTYHPMFTHYMVGTIVMSIESYARGRKGGFVTKT